MIKNNLIILVLFSICTAICSQTSDKIKKMYEKGERYFDKKEYGEALIYIQRAAEANYPAAQNLLGIMYQDGNGVEKNDSLAMNWYRKAADQGYAKAQNNLGAMYADGNGVPQDYAKAYEYFLKAADQGYAKAQKNLGIMYAYGDGVPQDYAKAYEYFLKAAEQGTASAQNHLGIMYENGYGVAESKFEAGLWYRKAAEQGYAHAQRGLGYIYDSCFWGENKRAVYWYKKAAEQGDVVAQFNLGNMYADGRGVEKNDSLAVYWFRKAAEQGDAGAQNNLGIKYENGHGIERNDSLAMNWFQKAAEQGEVVAQFNLGIKYENGRGIEKDDSLAVYWYRKAAEQGYAAAQNNLGIMYENGHGIERNDSLAMDWFQKAAEQGEVVAQFNLGMKYENGRGVEKNDSLAVYWYEMAAKQAHEGARDSLITIYENGKGVPKDISRAEYWKDKKKKDWLPLDEEDRFLNTEKRIALVIGNSDYEGQRLPNAEKDALALHKVLRDLNFEVEDCVNKDKIDMENVIFDFCEKAKKYDVALLYYAGHAVQEKGINYIVPVRPTKRVIDYEDLKNSFISLSLVIDSLKGTDNRKTIIILDACRDRPNFVYHTRGGQGGLARFSEPENFLVAFSTLAGEKAKDGTGQNNSPYMTALLDELQKPRQKIDDIFIHVRRKVIDMTKMEQIPIYWNNLNETEYIFYFNQGKNSLRFN